MKFSMATSLVTENPQYFKLKYNWATEYTFTVNSTKSQIGVEMHTKDTEDSDQFIRNTKPLLWFGH